MGADRVRRRHRRRLVAHFSDMLGDHTLATAFQLESGLSGNFSFKNTAAQVGYLNQANRWNWGVVGGQVPYLSGGIRSELGTHRRRAGR